MARPDPAAATCAVTAQVADRVLALHREGRQEIAFGLDPPELGGVRIEAVLDGQRLTLRIRAEHESARNMLAGALPRLRESLAEQGIVSDRLTLHVGLDASPRESSRHAPWTLAREPLPQPAPSAVRPVPAGPRPCEPRPGGLDLWV